MLVDVGAFARADIDAYREMGRALQGGSLRPIHPDAWQNIEEMLDDCHARYLTGGLASLRALPDASFDFIWSHAVLEHVRRDDFNAHMHELRRLLAVDGWSSHSVDLRDHLENALNHLRFSERRWERPLIHNSGFYTNRLRRSEIAATCQSAGFNVETMTEHEWAELPTPRSTFDSAFQHFSDDELKTAVITLRLRHAPIPTA